MAEKISPIPEDRKTKGKRYTHWLVLVSKKFGLGPKAVLKKARQLLEESGGLKKFMEDDIDGSS